MYLNIQLIALLILFITQYIPSASFSLEINVRKLNEVAYIDTLLNLSQTEKEIQFVAKISDNTSIKDFCTEASAYVFLKESNFDNKFSSIWSQIKIPSESWRKSIFLSYLKNFQLSIEPESENSYFKISYQNLLRDLKSNNQNEGNSVISDSMNRIQKMKSLNEFYKDLLKQRFNDDLSKKNLSYFTKGQFNLAGVFICSDLSSETVSCGEAVKKILEESTPTPTQIVFHKIWISLLTQQKNIDVLSKIAIKLLNRLLENKVENAYLFDDIYNEFKKSYNDTEAENLTWDTIALLSSGGGNTYRKLYRLGATNKNLEEILFILSNAPLVLDTLSVKNDYLYSYPKNIQLVCDTGKPYHFWSSAYFARTLINNGYSKNLSAEAAFSTQKLYQFGFNDAGRDSSLPFKLPQFDNYNNRIRLDLINSSLGAWFGANRAKTNLKMYENLFRTVFNKSEAIELNPNAVPVSASNPTKVFDQYKQWSKLFVPNTSFLILKP